MAGALIIVNLAKLTDEALVSLVARGDRDALAALYDRYSSLVFSLVVRVLGEGMSAEEVTQDAFMSVWRGAASFEPERGTFSGWLVAIARNRAIDELRRGRGRPLTDAEPLTAANGHSNKVYGSLEDASLRGLIVRNALAALPVSQRQAVELAFFHGMTHQEIAHYLGEPLGTVKTRIRLGLQRLKAVLQPLEEARVQPES
ncbi:MAG: hypothetical protein A2Z04_05425 [Chloroflexi bacterium RBG_16_57_9]|nr:MAG: hypothetical protein A2Z04_05425 [Chloroflexi bacterium RBG_16_57_9]